MIPIGTAADFEDGARRLIEVGDIEIGVIRHEGEFHAFENRCLHQGGPVCEGRIMGRVEAVLDDNRRLLGERFSSEKQHLICPWHGYEYDLRTGECAADPKLKLRRFEVVEEEGTLYVRV
jgi:nitrite reductase/ring-hydroxylating ferredoxin subunit